MDPLVQICGSRGFGVQVPHRDRSTLNALTPFTHMVLGGTVPHAQAMPMGVSLERERPVVQIYFNHCGGGGG